MDSLRIALIVIGVLLVVGIYLFGRNRRARSERPPRAETLHDEFPDVLMDDKSAPPDDDFWDDERFAAEHEPVPGDELDEVVPRAAATPEPEAAPSAAPLPDEVVVLTLMCADEEEPFSGPAILEAVRKAGLHHGKMGIFHYYPDTEGVGGEPWFSIANAVEPGVFDLDHMDGLATPGLALFLQLPGPERGERMFRHLLEVGHTMAEHLGGRLCDQQRRPLTRETAEELMERAARYD